MFIDSLVFVSILFYFPSLWLGIWNWIWQPGWERALWHSLGSSDFVKGKEHEISHSNSLQTLTGCKSNSYPRVRVWGYFCLKASIPRKKPRSIGRKRGHSSCDLINPTWELVGNANSQAPTLTEQKAVALVICLNKSSGSPDALQGPSLAGKNQSHHRGC